MLASEYNGKTSIKFVDKQGEVVSVLNFRKFEDHTGQCYCDRPLIGRVRFGGYVVGTGTWEEIELVQNETAAVLEDGRITFTPERTPLSTGGKAWFDTTLTLVFSI